MLRFCDEDSDSSYSTFSSSSSLGAAAPNLLPSESEETEPEGEEKICTVCGDKATGYHFHAMTCEGCKGFFRRSISKGIRFSCPFAQNCTITKAKRRQCQACRLQKCLDAGMRKDMIMSDEALMMRRALRNRKKQERLQNVQQARAEALTEEQEQLIQILVDAHKRNIDSSFPKFIEFKPPNRLLTHVVKSRTCSSPLHSLGSPPLPHSEAFQEEGQPFQVIAPEAFSLLLHLTDISTFMIQQMVKFAKEIPDFRSLPIDDQIALLKGATLEVCQLQFNTVFNEQTFIWECDQTSYTIEDGILIGYQREYLEPAVKFHVRLRRLRLHAAEYVLMEAIALFSPDRSGLTERDLIDKIQEKMAMTLKCYIDQKRPCFEGRFLYAKLLSLLTELRSLTMESTRQIFHIQDRNNFAMAPLLKEIMS